MVNVRRLFYTSIILSCLVQADDPKNLQPDNPEKIPIATGLIKVFEDDNLVDIGTGTIIGRPGSPNSSTVLTAAHIFNGCTPEHSKITITIGDNEYTFDRWKNHPSYTLNPDVDIAVAYLSDKITIPTPFSWSAATNIGQLNSFVFGVNRENERPVLQEQAMQVRQSFILSSSGLFLECQAYPTHVVELFTESLNYCFDFSTASLPDYILHQGNSGSLWYSYSDSRFISPMAISCNVTYSHEIDRQIIEQSRHPRQMNSINIPGYATYDTFPLDGTFPVTSSCVYLPPYYSWIQNHIQ